jgi:hypothetical protein
MVNGKAGFDDDALSFGERPERIDAETVFADIDRDRFQNFERFIRLKNVLDQSRIGIAFSFSFFEHRLEPLV